LRASGTTKRAAVLRASGTTSREGGSEMSTAAFVLNPGRVRGAARVAAGCAAAATAAGWDWLVLETSAGDRGTLLARQAVAAGAGLVFAVGGDGTVRACAEALAGTAIPLAIVPRGTANLAARALGIPHRLDAALAAGFRGHERRIDLATADGMTYAAMAGLGVDAAVVAAAPAGLKARAGWLAYAAAGARLAHGPCATFDLSLDGTPLTCAARSVVVGNAGLLPGGFVLLPGARLDDGHLDVGILAPSSLLDWGRVAHRVLTQSRRESRPLLSYRARHVEIRADRELPRQVDGEVIEPGRALTVTVLPAALLVRVPGPAAGRVPG
jgi:diacylglycerol kinase family enzyme